MRPRVLLLLALGLLVGVWGCFEVATRRAEAGGETARNVSIVEAGDGRVRSLNDLRGKVVLLDFWATWCGPCRASIPEVQRAYAKYHAKGFEVLGVAEERDDGSGILPFARQMGMTYPVGMPTDMQDAAYYSADGIPSMVLVDKRGKIRWKQTGYAPEVMSELKANLEQLLAE